jgi:electron transfer flavoprotein beta subunit
MLKIIVCIKAVPDPKQERNVHVDLTSGKIMRGNVPLVLNPLDRNAIEAALQIKEGRSAHISIISMGPPPAESIVRECLALGADEGVLLCDSAFAGGDALATAYTLSRGIEKLGMFDIVFCGMASSDGSTELVGPELAAFLKIPVITRVSEITNYHGEKWEVKASGENEYRRYRILLPAVFTVTREINKPRTIKFSGVLRAQQKEIRIWGIRDLEVPEAAVGSKGSPTATTVYPNTRPGARREIEYLTGSREEVANQLIYKLVEKCLIY